MEGMVIVFFLIIGGAIYFLRVNSHESSIESQIESIGGRLIGYEKRSIFSGIGPFTVVGKGRMVYKIDYEVNGVIKEGWVRFGGIMGPDWRL